MAGIDLTGMLDWRCIGPHRGGRVVAVAGDPVDPMTFYFGAVAGGVWKTTDGGQNWENVSDGFFTTAAIGALDVAPSDPNVIYVGTGEPTIRGNVSHGDGVYKSTDGGRTWANMGLKETRHIAKVRVHPQNPDLVYVAAFGHAWGPNPERGLYRTTDGGKSWAQILYRGERAGAIDLTLDPQNPRILYVAFWEAQRYPHALVSGGPGTGIFKSVDGGDTWTELTNNPGLPKGIKGKIGLAASPAKSNRVWALVEAEDGALFRSDDGGANWDRLSENAELRRRAWYYTHLYADPLDPETCYVLGLQSWRSDDGGKNFITFPTPHGDTHGLWLDPKNPRRMIEGNDGGACVSFNGGQTWSTILNQPTAQFYHVATDARVPYYVYGSQQDNTAICLPSLSSRGAITITEWEEPGGGESGYIAIRPDNTDKVFAGAIGSGAGHGRLIAYDRKTGQQRNITVWPEVHGMGTGAVAHKYRFQWTFPVAISQYDPNVLFIAGNHLFRSTDEGTSWEVISPDLTRNDESKLQPSGGPITRDNTGAETYCTIFAFAESPHQQGVFWAGTDDGLVHLSKDGGKTWGAITPPADLLPEWALISIIEPSPHDPATVYLAATRYKHDDTRPYLLKTEDWGQSWTSIAGDIPADDFTRTIRADPERRGLLFAGTETGIYVSFNDGGAWERLRGNFPITPVHDLIIEGSDLVVATHGRSFWILDDLTPLREIAGQRAEGGGQKAENGGAGDEPLPSALRPPPSTLFPPRPWVRYRQYEGYGYPPNPGGVSYRFVGTFSAAFRQEKRPTGQTVDHLLNAGKNPPDGAIITYSLAETPQELTLRFLDARGTEVKSFTRKPEEPGDDKGPWVPAEVGTNRFVWNGRYADAHKLKGDAKTDPFSGGDGMLNGPVAVPGHYTVELRVDGQTFRAPLEIVKDPRVEATQADLEEQFKLLLSIRDQLSETNDTINGLRAVRDQVDGWKERTKERPDAERIATAADNLRDALTAIEAELIDVKADSPLSRPTALNVKLGSLIDFIANADAVPTQGAKETFVEIAGRIDREIEHLEALIMTDLATFNALLGEASVLSVVLPKELT